MYLSQGSFSCKDKKTTLAPKKGKMKKEISWVRRTGKWGQEPCVLAASCAFTGETKSLLSASLPVSTDQPLKFACCPSRPLRNSSLSLPSLYDLWV